jgi:tetratricopeptide (TPR) repeat protein
LHHFEAGAFDAALEKGLEAGWLAQNTFAYPQAERAYRLALEASEHLEGVRLEVLEVEHHLAEVLSIGGRNHEAIKLWEGVIEKVASLEGGDQLLAQAKVALVKVLRFTTSMEHSLEVLGEPVLGTPLFEELCVELAVVYINAGKWDQARVYAIRALKTARRQGKLETQAAALRHLAWMESSNKRFDKADRLMALAIVKAEESGNNHVLSSIWVDRGTMYNRQERPDDASRAFERAGQYISQTSNVKAQAVIAINLARTLEIQDEFEEACENLEAAIVLAQRAGYAIIERSASYNLALDKYALGKLDEALKLFKAVRDASSDTISERALFFETHIMLERNDGFVIELPELKNQTDYGRLLEVEYNLSFGNYAQVLHLTERPNQEFEWFWSLARLHATWRLDLKTDAALATFRASQNADLKSSLCQQFSSFVAQVFNPNLTRVEHDALKLQAEVLFQSVIGIFARDVALSLHD